MHLPLYLNLPIWSDRLKSMERRCDYFYALFPIGLHNSLFRFLTANEQWGIRCVFACLSMCLIDRQTWPIIHTKALLVSNMITASAHKLTRTCHGFLTSLWFRSVAWLTLLVCFHNCDSHRRCSLFATTRHAHRQAKNRSRCCWHLSKNNLPLWPMQIKPSRYASICTQSSLFRCTNARAHVRSCLHTPSSISIQWTERRNS